MLALGTFWHLNFPARKSRACDLHYANHLHFQVGNRGVRDISEDPPGLFLAGSCFFRDESELVAEFLEGGEAVGDCFEAAVLVREFLDVD